MTDGNVQKNRAARGPKGEEGLALRGFGWDRQKLSGQRKGGWFDQPQTPTLMSSMVSRVASPSRGWYTYTRA